MYYRMPMLHGDDVAELQRCLNAIGFDAGNVDGIFGPDTMRALLDFQQNRGMAEDGIAGPLVIRDLQLMSRETKKMGRHEVRERAWLASLPATLAGSRVFVDPFCRTDEETAAAWQASVAAGRCLRDLGAHVITSRSSDTRPAERLRALHANERAATLVVAFAHPATDEPGVYSFASQMSHSEAGEAIARGLASSLQLKPRGRDMPILRETRATAVVIASDGLDGALGDLTAVSIERWLGSQAASRARS